MRRKDREITDRDEMIKVMENCDVCRLGLNDGDFPYIVPLNFGMQEEDGKIVFYFHGAKEGKKYELIEKNPHATFEMDCGHELFLDEEKQLCGMTYESIMGKGIVEIVPDEQKYQALCILMRHYRGENFPFDKRPMTVTTVFKLTVSEMSGKRRVRK